MSKFICVVVDTNDADWAESLTEVKDESDIQIVSRIYNYIKKNNIDYGDGEVSDFDIEESELSKEFTKTELDIFSRYMPYCEWGFHTLEEISIITGTKESL